MQGISGMFNLSRLALFANQTALATTSQNIANANTPGYTRQEAVLASHRPVDGRPGQIGTGVTVTEIRRVVDRFVENQITSGESNLGHLQTKKQYMQRIESVFTDLQGTGLNQAFSDLFSAIQDVSTNPQSLPERIILQERAQALSQVFIKMDSQFQQPRQDVNTEILGVINNIDALSAQIATLNGEISQAEITGQQANDLRDQRQLLLNDLAKEININSFENDVGELTIFVGNGKALVEGRRGMRLFGLPGEDNSGFVNVSYDPGTGSTVDITSEITNGRLKGLLDLRDTTLPDTINQLDQLAASMVNVFNQQHRVGVGLDGSTGNDFFAALSPQATPLAANAGSALSSVSISDPTLLTFNDYDLTFSAGNVSVRNIDTGTTTTTAYADPTTILFEGLQIDVSGVPVDGDIFLISAHQGTAGSLSVAVADPNQIAAAGAAADLPGGNSNALLLASLQETGITPLGGADFQSFYSALVGRVGSESRLSQNELSVEEVIQAQLDNIREETSGVSIDEEMTNLIKFQRAYEASARIITVADELLQTIIGLKR